MKYGIFGGAFDPPHQGHFNLAAKTCSTLGLDKIFWVPTPDPPHKDKPITPFLHRLAMVQLFIRGYTQFEASDLESTLPAPSYSLNLIRAFKAQFGANHIWHFLIGADNWAIFPKWHQPEQVLKEAILVVFPRSNIPLGQLPPRVLSLDFPELPLQSSHLRQELNQGKKMEAIQVPVLIQSYILENRLYGIEAKGWQN